MDATPEGKTLPWTEEAKFQLLLHIVAQLKEGNRPIKWERINIPGRTTKSLQNMWTKINKIVGDIEKAQENGVGATPTKAVKKATPRSARAKKAELAFDEDVDDDSNIEQKTPSKKRGKGEKDGASGAKRMKVEAKIEDFAATLKKEDDFSEDSISAEV